MAARRAPRGAGLPGARRWSRTGCGAAPGSASPTPRRSRSAATSTGATSPRPRRVADAALTARRRRGRPAVQEAIASLLRRRGPVRGGAGQLDAAATPVPDRQPGLGPVAADHGAGALRGLGRTDEAVALVEEEVALLRRWGAPSSSGRRCGCSAELRGPDGLDGPAGGRRAAGGDAAGVELARAQVALGAAPRVADDEAVPLLRAAAEAPTACGAQAIELRACAALQARGRRGRRCRRTREPAAVEHASSGCSTSRPGPRRPRGRPAAVPDPGHGAGRARARRGEPALKSVSSPPRRRLGVPVERNAVTQQQVPTTAPRPRGEPARPVRRRRAPARRPRLRRGALAVEPRCPTIRPPSPTRRSPTRSPRWSAPPRRPACRSPPQGTGHGAPPLEGRLADAVLLRTSAMTELHDRPRAADRPGRRRRALGRPGRGGRRARLAALHPSSPDVGVVGYSLGGGIGWYARRFGLQCNAVTAVELVLADGTFVRATADAEPELFWALRGGAAPLGVVTALEFDLFPVETVVAGFLAWDWTAVEQVLPALGGVVRATPRTRRPRRSGCSTCRRRARARRTLRGRRLVDHRRRRARRRRVRRRGARAAARAAPGVRHRRAGPGRVAGPAAPRPGGPDPGLREQHPRLRAARRRGRGGRRGRRAAVGHRPGRRRAAPARRRAVPAGPARGRAGLARRRASWRSASGWRPSRRDWPQQRADAARFLAAVEPWATGRQYLPMLDDRTDTRKAFPPGVHARLSAVRRGVDPDGLFLAPHHSAASPERPPERLEPPLKARSTARQGPRRTVLRHQRRRTDRRRP